MTPGGRAAVEVARERGLRVDGAVLIQETNNTVVWLRPESIIAKVGTHEDSAEGLIREWEVATALVALGAPVARPLPGSFPVLHSSTGFMVTLWCRLESAVRVDVSGLMVGRSLRQIHQALGECDLALPSFRVGLDRARRALADDERMDALDTGRRAMLRAAFDDLLSRLDDQQWSEQSLHGEPHDGNYIVTPVGLRWIDFEGACRGPLELDLAFLPEQAQAAFEDVDVDLLALLQVLNSARVATWCSIQARFPEMRRHGDQHLAIVQSKWHGRS